MGSGWRRILCADFLRENARPFDRLVLPLLFPGTFLLELIFRPFCFFWALLSGASLLLLRALLRLCALPKFRTCRLALLACRNGACRGRLGGGILLGLRLRRLARRGLLRLGRLLQSDLLPLPGVRWWILVGLPGRRRLAALRNRDRLHGWRFPAPLVHRRLLGLRVT